MIRTMLALALSAGAATATPLALGDLYGIQGILGSELSEFVTLAPKTGAQSSLGAAFAGLDCQDLSTMDSKRGIYYGLFLNATAPALEKHPEVIGFNVADGSVAFHRYIDEVGEMGFVGVGQHIQVDDATGDLFISGGHGDASSGSTNFTHRVIKMDPTAAPGKKSPIEVIFELKVPAISILGGTAAFDSTDGVFYFESCVTPPTNGSDTAPAALTGRPLQLKKTLVAGKGWRYGVDDDDTHTRRALRQSLPPIPPFEVDIIAVATRGAATGLSKIIRMTDRMTEGFSTMDYDVKSKKLVGLAGVDTVREYDGATGKWSERAAVTGFTGSMGQISTIDVAKRTLFALLSTGGSQDFTLAQINIDDGSVMCESGTASGCPILCNSMGVPCPWSFEARHATW